MEQSHLIDEIMSLGGRVVRATGQSRPDAWMDLDLSVAQLRTLFLISRDAKASTKRLSEKLGVTPSNVSGLVDRLFKHGLVSRQEDPDDRRMLRLRVTDKGASVLADGLRLLAEAAEAHRDGLGMP